MKGRDLINEAEHLMNKEEFKQCVIQVSDFLPSIAEMSMNIYQEFIKVGFTEGQAFSFAKDYILKLLIK